MFRRLHILVPIILLIAGIGLRAYDPPLISSTRFQVFDFYQRIHPRPYEPAPVRVIDIDQAALERHGQWPWPRTVFADLIGRLNGAGAAVIVLDMVLAEPDRTSPTRVVEHWKTNSDFEEVRSIVESLPDHDQYLADQIAAAAVVGGFILTDDPSASDPPKKARFVALGDAPQGFLRPFAGTIGNLAPFGEAATGIGAVNANLEQDAIIRKVPVLFSLKGELYPSLIAETLRVALGGDTYVVKSSGASGVFSYGEETGIISVKLDTPDPGTFLVIPTTENGEVWLYQSERVPQRVISARDILDASFDPALIEGSIVFVGTSAVGLHDLRTTALHPSVAGVEVHAQITEQILTGTYLYRPNWIFGAEILGLVIASVMVVIMVLRTGAAMGLAFSVIFTTGACLISWQFFAETNTLTDPVYPSIVFFLVYIGAAVSTYLTSEQERRQVRSAFGRYMSPVLLDQLPSNINDLRLGGEMRDMTILFSDIRNFSGIAEGMDPQDLTQLINRALTPLTNSIQDHKGLIDKYIGDAVMAFWNAPLDDPDHIENACLSALAMLESLEELNVAMRKEARQKNETHKELRIGIGIASGECCVGNMGSNQRFDYSVLGDTVNLAARLEGQTKSYGVVIIISENAHRAVAGKMAAIEIDLVQVKGRQAPETIFALLGGADMLASEEFKLFAAGFAEMLAAYKQMRWKDAMAKLTEIWPQAVNYSVQELMEIYQNRLENFMENPPPDDWNGVFVATSK